MFNPFIAHESEILKFPPFPSRGLLIASANMLKTVGHAGFEELRLGYDLLDTQAGLGSGLAARATSLATYAVLDPELRTPEGIYLQSAIVARAGDIYRNGVIANIGEKERQAFKAASSASGTMNDVSQSGLVTDSVPRDGFLMPTQNGPTQGRVRQIEKTRKIFVVHGHDVAVRTEVTAFLKALEFEPVILNTQTNQGRTLIEKFEANADVGYAVILLTPDDVGNRKGDTPQPRARQNVILEWGYFVGRLGRSKVCALKKNDLELPSDLIGIVWETFDDHGGWKNRLARELEDAGFSIDWQKASRS